MNYSTIGFLAIIMLLITNHDVLWNRERRSFTLTQRHYRGFLLAVLVYYITDVLWGILDAYRLTSLQSADTTV